MAKIPPKVYVGCSLTQAPPEFAAAVEAVKNDLRTDCEILDFLGLTKGTAADVYHWDIQRNVAVCDLFVAICDYPAIGLGYELATAIEKFAKPVLALARQDTRISRLVIGIDTPNYSLVRYSLLTDIPNLIRARLSELNHIKDQNEQTVRPHRP